MAKFKVTPKVKKVGVMVKRLKVKMRKLSVDLLPVLLSEYQTNLLKQLKSQKIAKKKNARKKVKVKPTLRNKDASAASSVPTNSLCLIHVSDSVPQIKEMLSRGKVLRLTSSLRWRWDVVSLYENYGLGSQQSIQADDEDSPKKKVPRWAEEKMIIRALTGCVDVDPDQIFSPCEPPDLVKMFPSVVNKRMNIWNSPTSGQAICSTPQPQPEEGSIQEDEEISFHLVPRNKTSVKNSKGADQQTQMVGKVLFKDMSNNTDDPSSTVMERTIRIPKSDPIIVSTSYESELPRK